MTAPTYPRPTTTTFIREVSSPVAWAARHASGKGNYLRLLAETFIGSQPRASSDVDRDHPDEGVVGMPNIVAMTLRRCVCALTPLRASSRRIRSTGDGSGSAGVEVAGCQGFGGTRSTSLYLRMFFAVTARSCSSVSR